MRYYKVCRSSIDRTLDFLLLTTVTPRAHNSKFLEKTAKQNGGYGWSSPSPTPQTCNTWRQACFAESIPNLQTCPSSPSIIIIVYRPFSMLRTGWRLFPNQAPQLNLDYNGPSSFKEEKNKNKDVGKPKVEFTRSVDDDNKLVLVGKLRFGKLREKVHHNHVLLKDSIWITTDNIARDWHQWDINSVESVLLSIYDRGFMEDNYLTLNLLNNNLLFWHDSGCDMEFAMSV